MGSNWSSGEKGGTGGSESQDRWFTQGSRRKYFSTKSVTARLAGLLKIRPGGSRELRAQKSEPGGNGGLANLG